MTRSDRYSLTGTAIEQGEAGFLSLFSRQVERAPDTVAVLSGDRRVTYAALDRAADRLARRLRAMGVGPESTVGLQMERSPELLVAILAILEAGGAYVPLDPATPAERAAFILEDARAAVLVTERPLLARLPRPVPRALCLDDPGAPADLPQSSWGALPTPSPDGLAYVIYTSGTTGTPKGVMIRHGALGRLMAAHHRVHPGPVHSFLLLPSVAVDASIPGLFWTLCEGGSVVLPPEGGQSDPEGLLALVARHGISHWLSVPALYAAVLAAAEPTNGAALAALRKVMVAGEACPPALVEHHFALLPGVALCNEYGPTEGTVWATFHPCHPREGRSAVPIGSAIPGMRVYRLDPLLAPVPTAVAGEVWLGGESLARGYLGRPALTAERFLPDPFAERPGARMYRTGDLAGAESDGALSYLGRLDHQIKLRGVRIEPGEIEALLGLHAGVEAAAVVPRDDRLVAWFVPRPGRPPAARELREFLARHLPETMIPAVFAPLSALPLTAAGKVDRRALAGRDAGAAGAAGAPVAPKNPIEQVLAGIWSDLLGVDPVGVEDGFLELGGHSLLAGRVMARIQETFGVELPVAALFGNPTVAALAERIAERGSPATRPPALQPIDRRGPLPLSFSQQRVWYLAELAPTNIAYHTQVTLHFAGRLVPAALEAALSEIVRRHEVLRTSFATVGGRPVQTVRTWERIRLPMVDLSALPAERRAAESALRLAAEGRRPFDLGAVPLARWQLLRLGPGEHLLIQTEHHLVHDGWSLAVLLREMTVLYRSAVAGRPSPLPPLPVQFVDVAAWQRRWLDGEVLAAYLAHWRGKLADGPPPVELPTDRPRPAVPSFRGAIERGELPVALYRAAKALCRRQGVTLFMALFGGFAALLARATGERRFVVGTTVANRRRRETENLIGMLVNNLVLRADLSGDPAFGEILARVRREALDAFAYEDLPFDKLVEALQPRRTPDRNPLFQHMFSAHDSPLPELDFGADVAATLAYRHHGSAKFDLDVVVIPRGEQLAGQAVAAASEQVEIIWEYSTDLFEPVTMRRMLQRYLNLLEGAVADPGRRLSELPLLSAAEESALLREWNDTALAAPAAPADPEPVHRLFAARARRAPHAVAVVCEESALTYGELDRRANRLAHHLRSLGAGPESLLGLRLERSLDLPVALLATLKAGAAYLPLDPSYPEERLAAMTAEAPVALVLAEPAGGGAPAGRELDLPPPSWTDGDSLAYVISTSGSTGRPKGISIAHRGLANLATEIARRYALAPGDRVLQFASISFDVAGEELYPAWLSGATVVLSPARGLGSLAEAGRWLAREQITVLNLPASYWHEWVAELERAGRRPPACLRLMVVGSERVSRQRLAAWRTLAGDEVAWYNAYGPTEATITAALYAPGAVERWASSDAVPIGRPIANTCITLADPDGNPVPIGGVGEVRIGGVGLARGYLGQPALTAERFVPCPQGEPPGGRLFRTGDLARHLPDGTLEILGRADAQIKVRGFRVEPGEIEVALLRHPGLREAVVGVRQDPGGHARLVAWVVASGAAPLAVPATDELRRFLARQLPEHMVPSVFVAVAALPRLPGGKVDRRGLPDPDLARPEREAPLVLPRTPTEERVAGLWSAALGLDRVGVEDDFFAAGGHSLLATQLLFEVCQACAVEIPLRRFLARPTVAELAAAVEEARGAVPAAGSAVRLAGGAAGPSLADLAEVCFPLSFAQRRLWFLHRLEPESPFYNFARALALRGPLDSAALAAALGEVLRRHTALRTAFLAAEGRPLQQILPPPARALAVVDLAALPEGRREAAVLALARQESRRPFDLTRPPLLRATLLRAGAADHCLLLSLHHIAFDGWSMGILAAELAALYAAARDRRPSPLPELPCQYVDFTLWERRWLTGKVRDEQLAYWRRRLAGAPALLELPADRPRPARQSFRGARRSRLLPAALAAALRELARRRGASLFMVLLAGFKALLRRYLGQDDLVVGAPAANRARRELEGLIGFFSNTLVLRTDLAGDPGFAELLARVRETALGAFAHQDLPFEQLVLALQPERSVSHAPLFQILFVLQNVPPSSFALPGLATEVLEIDNRVSIFDLTLGVEDEPTGLSTLAQYSTDLFDGPTIARLLGHLERLLEGAVRDPGLPLSALPLLSAGESWQLVGEWNDTGAGFPTALPIPGLIAAQVARAPEAVAVVFAGQCLSYGELAARAGRLAGALRRLGVGPEVRVGICAERSLDLIVGLNAILRAGGAYVPLDAAYPAERLAFMLEDAGVAVLLADGHLAAALPTGRAQVVRLDGPLSRAGDPSPDPEVDLDHLAYVIYTSGSTGRPKGAMNSHRGIVNRLLWMQEQYALTPADRVLQKTPVSFDVSVWELFSPLLAGACLVVARPGGHQDPSYLVEVLAREEVTVLHFVPVMLAAFLEAPGVERLSAVRQVIASGEALSSDLERRFFARSKARLDNLYGPTEAAVEVTFWPCARAGTGGRVPIGRPLANTGIHLLDRELRPVPPGAPGELYIGGVQVARGYHGRPELTAERFLPDPFAARGGERLYRTGDLARHLPDGAVEYLGRLDHQVKVRGVRIELGEIEAALLDHPAVRQAAVTVSEGDGGDRRLVAYLVPAAGPAPADGELRRFLARTLPEPMVPAVFVPLAAFPLSPSGKVDRRALAATRALPRAAAAYVAPGAGLERAIAELWREVLGVDRVGLHDNFFDLGGHSLLLTRVQSRLAERCKVDLPIVDLLRYPTVGALARHLGGGAEPRPTAAAAAPRPEGERETAIAVIGMAGRFPGARDVEELWRNLCSGVEGISTFTALELAESGVDEGERGDPAYVPAAGVLGDADLFDAPFFGCTPRQAEVMDPQQRHFLECAWTALELAGYDPVRYPGRIGVFAGAGLNTYWLHHLAPNPQVARSVGTFQTMLLNDKDFLPTRVSYKLNLRGPSVSVQTACSTSLVAVHLACRSLRAGECEMALAGGVSIRVPEKVGYRFQDGGIMSPDGHCRAFDAAARGTVGGNGVAIVVLKRLADALADGDSIRAVIRGSAINNDGAGKVGFTAPGVRGQVEVIADALAQAHVRPAEISYVEAHGTGTPLGDPIEIAALTEVFRQSTGERGFCAVGSLKSNLGHLDAAAGAAGLIKTVLMLERRALPPSLHFTQPNPALDLASTPFYVNVRLRPWEAGSGPRRAGVSSFGIGGTNAHVVLEEAPPAAAAGPGRGWQLLLLSAQTETALETLTGALAEHLGRYPRESLADAAYTLQVGRRRFAHRRALVCRDAKEAAAALAGGGAERLWTAVEEAAERPVVMMFPGQGAQYAGMGRELYRREAVFRREVDRCADLLLPHLGSDLRALLFADGDDSRLGETRFTQPALFVVEYALAQLLGEWGVKPAAMIGHSIGEYVAACLAGVFSLADALALVALRGRLIQELPAGAMVSVALAEEELLPLLGEVDGRLALAAVNAPARAVVAGPGAAVEALERRLGERGVSVRRLRTSHAFHSPMMDPVLARFAERLAEVELQPPRLPFLSCVTGSWIEPAAAVDPGYWAAHLRRTVRFADGIRLLREEPAHLFLEVGPGRSLGSLVRRQGAPGEVVLATLPQGDHGDGEAGELPHLLAALGRLWLAGVEPDWERFHAPGRRRRIALPTYPFERRRYWIERVPEAAGARLGREAGLDVLETFVPVDARRPADRPYLAPETELEGAVAAAWRELLGIERIGRQDDFFELGGDSLLATQLLARLRESFAVDIPLRGMFEAPTVAALAELIEERLIARLEGLSDEDVQALL